LSLMRAFIRRASVYVRHTIVCVALFGLLLSMFWTVSYSMSVYHRRQAERMLRQLAALQPGATDYRTVQRIARDSGGKEYCTNEFCRYDFDNNFPFTGSWSQRVLRRTEWDYFGLRPWQVSALIIKRGSQTTEVGFSVIVGQGRGPLFYEGPFSGNMWAWRMASVTINSERFGQLLGLEKESDRESAIRNERHLRAGSDGIILKKPSFDIVGGGEALEVYLAPDAPPASRRIAFDLNLRCATAMSPCSELCQLAPSAWRSYVQFIKSDGLSVGEPADCSTSPTAPAPDNRITSS
jgi:hypothetical protein